MAVYTANIVTSSFTCNARSEEEAEEKYDAWFNGGDCGCEAQGLKCICGEDDNNVDHYWEVWEEL